MRKLGVFILALVTLLLAVTFLWLSLRIKDPKVASSADNVRINSLRFCGAEISSTTHLQKLRLCGSVVSNKPLIPIRMYLYEMPDNTLIGENPVNDKFFVGDFVREFDFLAKDGAQSYKVVAYFYKEVIGELEFNVDSP
jgi:hypothetical protein